MRVIVGQEGAITVVKRIGPIVNGELEELDRELSRLFNHWIKRIVINMTEVVLVDSAGLELLNRYSRMFSSHGMKLKLCGLNEMTRKILDLTQLSRRFEIFADTTTSIRSFL